MAISRISTASASATSVTFGTHASGDVIIIFAYRDGSATPPTIPSGWTAIQGNSSAGANTNSAVLCYKVAASSSETSGTWTNATELGVVVLRGVNTTQPFGWVQTASAASTSVNYGAVNVLSYGGIDNLYGFAGHRSTNTTLETPPTNMTNIVTLVDATAEIAIHEQVGATIDWPATAVSVGGTSSGWCSFVLEVLDASVVITNINSGTTSYTPSSDGNAVIAGWGGGAGGTSTGGGGAGAFALITQSVTTSSAPYTVSVGAGSAGSSSGTSTTASDTSFINSSTLLAKGGTGSSNGGSGGASTTSVGTIKFKGGNGGNGGGGGGSAGSLSNGGNGSSGVAGAGGNGSPSGAAGGLNGTTGSPGNAPGGGGGQGSTGGAGANGRITVYLTPTGGTTVTKNQTSIARISKTVQKTQSAVSRISRIVTKTQVSTARVASNRVKTQGATARIATGTVSGIIFRSESTSSGDFTSVTGSNVTVGSSNNGYTGNSIRINYTGAYSGDFVNKTLSTSSDIIQVRFKIASAATMNGTDDAVLLSLFDNTSYGTAVGQIRALGSGSGFSLRIVDPSNSYSGDYSNATVFAKGVYHTLIVKRKSTGIDVYFDASSTAILSYSFTQTGSNFPAFSIGNFYSASGAIAGNVDFDDVFAKVTNTISTEADRINDAIEGYIQRYHSATGAIVRPIDPVGGQTTPDVVSESIAYGMKLYVQNNMQTYFDETFTWAYNNMRRGSTPGGSPTTNTPTNAYYLYGFKYDVPGHVLADGNWAGDADPEIAQSLLWAHARWGSAGTIDYQARALEIIGDLRTYAFRQSSGTGYYYLMNDSFQSSTTVQLGGDYDNPAGYRLFAQYDSSNASFWNAAAQGAYDYQTKAANYIFSPQTVTSKLTPNWAAMTLSSAAISGTSTYGDSDWGYNSFRFYNRAHDDYTWYSTSAATTLFALPKTFVTSEWATNSNVKAEYYHDGTVKGSYEASLFYYPYYFVLHDGDTSNTTAAAIASGKFPTYTQNPSGGYFGSPGYFGDSWLPIYRMQIAGTYTNYGQINQTTKTQGATARIASLRTKTQNSVARVSKIVTKTQPSMARIAKSSTKTQSAIARVSQSFTRTQSAISRVSNTRTRTQTATANIVQASSISKTQPTIARIANTRATTQTSIARIQRNLSKTQSSTARIAQSVTKTQQATARLAKTVTKTQGAIARLQKIVIKVQPSIARVATNRALTQPATARVSVSKAKTQPTIARISKTVTSTQTATARLVKTVSKTQGATARIVQGYVKTQSSIARIATTVTKTQPSIARISQTRVKTQPATAKIAKNLVKTQSATAKIVQAMAFTTIQTAKARIAVRGSKTQLATARLGQTGTKTQSSTARISKLFTKTQTATARLAKMQTKTQTASAYLAAKASKTQRATAYIVSYYNPGTVNGSGSYIPKIKITGVMNSVLPDGRQAYVPKTTPKGDYDTSIDDTGTYGVIS